jgi:hypothetical protein
MQSKQLWMCPFQSLKGLILWMGISLSFLNYAMESKQLWMCPFPALKGLILWMGISLSFCNYAMQSKQLWMCPEQIYKKYFKSRMSQTLDWLPFCSERLSVRWLAWLPYFGKFLYFYEWLKLFLKSPLSGFCLLAIYRQIAECDSDLAKLTKERLKGHRQLSTFFTDLVASTSN